jgi:hypothetical protein
VGPRSASAVRIAVCTTARVWAGLTIRPVYSDATWNVAYGLTSSSAPVSITPEVTSPAIAITGAPSR